MRNIKLGVETAKRNPFCTAMHWLLSPSHFERQVARFGEDECDVCGAHEEGLGRGNFPIDKLPMPHAQCLCAQYAVVPALSDVADRLGRWVDGGSDRELERAFGVWRKENAINLGSGLQYTKEMNGAKKPPPMRREQYNRIVRALGKKNYQENIRKPAGLTGLYRRLIRFMPVGMRKPLKRDWSSCIDGCDAADWNQ